MKQKIIATKCSERGMVTNMRRVLSMILTLAVVSASGTTALAAELKNQADFKSNYEVASQIFVNETDFQDIKRSDTDGYAMEVETTYGTALQPVGRLDISVDNEKSLEILVANDSIPAEIKVSICEEYERAKAMGNNDVEITYFSAAILDSGTNARGGALGTDESITKVYNGYNMRSDRVYYSGLSTGWEYIASGSKAYSTISNITSVALTCAGLTPIATVSFAAAGISLLQIFLNAYSSAVVGGHTDDYAQARLIYDKVDQWTLREIGGSWYLGLTSMCATVTKIGSEVYLWDSSSKTGKTKTTDRTVNIYVATDNYEDPWAIAYQYSYATYVEELSWEVGSKEFVF